MRWRETQRQLLKELQPLKNKSYDTDFINMYQRNNPGQINEFMEFYDDK